MMWGDHVAHSSSCDDLLCSNGMIETYMVIGQLANNISAYCNKHTHIKQKNNVTLSNSCVL